jgi:hypothetical protein
MQVTVVDVPSITGDAFPGQNHKPLHANPLGRLPLGCVQPGGWLRRQLELMAEGMTGRLSEISPFLAPDNGWLNPRDPLREGWEEQPYWLRGFYSLARLTGNPRLLEQASRWMEAVLTSQDEDGYFGPQANKSVAGKNGQVVCDLWPNMIMLDAVIRHHEATGDERVVPFMTRFFAFCRDLPDARFIPVIGEGFGNWKVKVQRQRAGDMLPHILWLYNQTGDEWLLPLATRFYRCCHPPLSEWLEDHVINFIQRFSYYGVYGIFHDFDRRLAQSEYWYRQHMETWGQQPGGIFGADEHIRAGCTDPRQGFETCGFGEFAKVFYLLGRMSGKALYADRVETLLYNHFPASSTPDYKALHYITASNQPQLDATEQHEYQRKNIRMVSYSPSEVYRCCQHNVAMTWPWLCENLWQASADGGLVAWIYADSTVETTVGSRGRTVRIKQTTDYPFGGAIAFDIACQEDVEFPFYLRIPAWCKSAEVVLNGASLDLAPQAGTYVRISRNWRNGDELRVTFRQEITLTTWLRTGSVTVNRGPLSYALKIEEQWRKGRGLGDNWPDWELFPASPWNYGLLLDPGRPITEKQLEWHPDGQPWTLDHAPIELTAHARRIPRWKLVNETAAELQESPIQSSEVEERVTLIPLGCARLRISCFPRISESPDASAWLS